jgi:hypothetical protein
LTNSDLADATLAPLSPSSNIIDKTAATAKVGAQINLITAAITSTTNEIAALPHVNATKRSLDSSIDSVSTDLIESPKHEKRQLIAVAALLSLIIVEIFATVGAAILVLGLGVLVIFTTPLTSSLSLLILTGQAVLNVVLAGVVTLLNTILGSLALALSGL